jgi:hypothetical protein
LRALDHAQRGGAPAAQHGRIDQQHAARQLGVAGGGHQAQEAAQRMADQEGRLAGLVGLRGA